GCSNRWLAIVTQADLSRRNSTPRRFNALTKSRFLRDRQRLYRARIEGVPSDRQATDRLVHHVTIFEMNVESYRRRAALERKRGRGRRRSTRQPRPDRRA